MQREKVRQGQWWIATASWQSVHVEPSELGEAQFLKVALPVSRHALPYIACEQVLGMPQKVKVLAEACSKLTSSVRPRRQLNVGHSSYPSFRDSTVCEPQPARTRPFDQSYMVLVRVQYR